MYYIQHCSLLSLQTYSNTCKTWSHNPACHTSRVAVVFGQCVCVWHFGHETNESLSQSPFIWGSEDFPDNKAFIFFLANSEKHTLEKTHTLWEKHMCGSKMCTHTHPWCIPKGLPGSIEWFLLCVAIILSVREWKNNEQLKAGMRDFCPAFD